MGTRSFLRGLITGQTPLPHSRRAVAERTLRESSSLAKHISAAWAGRWRCLYTWTKAHSSRARRRTSRMRPPHFRMVFPWRLLRGCAPGAIPSHRDGVLPWPGINGRAGTLFVPAFLSVICSHQAHPSGSMSFWMAELIQKHKRRPHHTRRPVALASPDAENKERRKRAGTNGVPSLPGYSLTGYHLSFHRLFQECFLPNQTIAVL